jgi:hypothetical protein
MSKTKAVAELEELEQSLEQIAGPQPTEPRRELTTKVLDNGWTQRECFCEAHGEYYDVFAPPRHGDVVVGDGCRQCKAHTKLLAQADAELSRRSDEIKASVRALEPEYEGDVQRQLVAELDAEVERYRAEIRPDLEADIRGRLWVQLRTAEEDRVREEILASLREPKQ